MLNERERIKARMRFFYGCDGIELTEAELKHLADGAEEASSAAAHDPAWLRAQARAKVEGRSVAELLLEEAKR